MRQVRESFRRTSEALATWVRSRDYASKAYLTREVPTDGCHFIEEFSELHDKINKNDFDAQREILRVMDGCGRKLYRTPRGRDNKASATPLHFAAFRGSNKDPAPMDIVKTVVHLHRDCLDLRNGANRTALHLACSVGNMVYATALLNAMADPNLCVDTEKGGIVSPLDFVRHTKTQRSIGNLLRSKGGKSAKRPRDDSDAPQSRPDYASASGSRSSWQASASASARSSSWQWQASDSAAGYSSSRQAWMGLNLRNKNPLGPIWIRFDLGSEQDSVRGPICIRFGARSGFDRAPNRIQIGPQTES